MLPVPRVLELAEVEIAVLKKIFVPVADDVTKSAVPVTSQSPAVNDLEVKFVTVLVNTEAGPPVFERYSPMFPAVALSFVVVPGIRLVG